MTIIVTLLPPKKGKRKLVISAAPEGEMPLLITGEFSERHALLDRAYATVMKRDPQVVTLPADKTTNKANRAPKTDAQISDEVEEAADQEPAPLDRASVTDESVPVSPIIGTEETDELPAIEGDTVETLQATSPQDEEEASDGEPD